MNKEFKKNVISITVLVTFLGLFAIVTMTPQLWRTVHVSEYKFEKLADNIITTCSKTTYPPSCYDETIPKLMDRGLSMEDAFHVTSIIQSKDQNYFYCHVLGHNLSAKETAKDLSKWTEVIARAPTGVCSNGAIHGASQERFRDAILTRNELQDILPQLTTICEDSDARTFTDLEKASCHHAIGHLTMYMTGANVADSTAVCDDISEKLGFNYTQTCYEGVYMQIFQPLEPEDFALIKDIEPHNQQEAEAFCDTFSYERRSACHRESWPLYRDEITKNADALQRFCSLVPDHQSVKRCFNAMFYVLTAQLNFDKEKITAICESLPVERRGQCFGNSASRFIETDYRLASRAVELCQIAEIYGVGDRCYEELLFYSTFNFQPDTPAFVTFCGTLPEPWNTKCLNKEGYDAKPSEND